jgi:hypothetical protein
VRNIVYGFILIIFLFLLFSNITLLIAKGQKKDILKEILVLNWGSDNGQIGYEKGYSKEKIANSLGGHYGPSDFCIDKNECVYIFDCYNNRVLRFENQILCKTYFYGHENGYYGTLHVDNNNNLYVIFNLPCKQKVFKYDTYGNILSDYLFTTSNTNLPSPKIETDKEQNIYFLKYKEPYKEQTYVIKKISKDKKYNKEFIIDKMIWDWSVNNDGVIYFLSRTKDDKYEMYFYNDNKINQLFSLSKKHDRNYLSFFGIDDENNLYFCEELRKLTSEKGKIPGVIVFDGDAISVQQNSIIYKYNCEGKLLKTITIDDPTPYDIKINSKGNIYLSPCLYSQALLVAIIDKYRIYKCSF